MDMLRSLCALQVFEVGVCIILLAVGCGGPDHPSAVVNDLPPHQASAVPEWENRAESSGTPINEPTSVDLFLDLSYPMAGYLPPVPSNDTMATFQIVTQNLAHHMARVYGGSDVRVRWRGIGRGVKELPSALRVSRDLFTGESSRLDMSVREMVANLENGKTRATALVTDLMATEGAIIGPTGIAGTFREWLQSDLVQSGQYHVGLLGFKAEYWGVTHPATCPPKWPQPGCWYDELAQAYRRLERVVPFPVYVLIIGVSSEGVMSVMESLLSGIDEIDRDVESRWELLTRRTKEFEVSVVCSAAQVGSGGELLPQHALFVDIEGRYDCRRPSRVVLSCEADGGRILVQPVKVQPKWMSLGSESEDADGSDDNGSGARGGPSRSAMMKGSARIRDRLMEIDVACATIAEEFVDENRLVLDLEFTGEAAYPDDPQMDWSEWSTEVGTIGKTPHLEGFIEAVQVEPDRYRVRVPRLLEFGE